MPGDFGVLNQQPVGSWDTNRAEYTRIDPATGKQIGRCEAGAQDQYRAEQVQLHADGLVRDHGLDPDTAHARARTDLAKHDVPDQSIGGNPLQFTGLGDGGVNRSIGSQWGGDRGNAARLEQAMLKALRGLRQSCRNVPLVTHDRLGP